MDNLRLEELQTFTLCHESNISDPFMESIEDIEACLFGSYAFVGVRPKDGSDHFSPFKTPEVRTPRAPGNQTRGMQS